MDEVFYLRVQTLVDEWKYGMLRACTASLKRDYDSFLEVLMLDEATSDVTNFNYLRDFLYGLSSYQIFTNK